MKAIPIYTGTLRRSPGIERRDQVSQPGYKQLDREEFRHRLARLYRLARRCRLCPRKCGTQRLQSREGFCGQGLSPTVASYGPHPGEESVLRGWRGSGTIFFSGCNLGCIFCQNYDLSHQGRGREISVRRLSEMMLDLQSRGCHNVNLVSPTHAAPGAMAALYLASQGGLGIPLVYNTGGYDSVELLETLEGLVDIYMPDVKYAGSQLAGELSDAGDYPQVIRRGLREMYRQAGPLEVDRETGLASRGLLVRHLVLPGQLEDTRRVLELVRDLAPGAGINVMGQYYPAHRAYRHPQLRRLLTRKEHGQAVRMARDLGLHLVN